MAFLGWKRKRFAWEVPEGLVVLSWLLQLQISFMSVFRGRWNMEANSHTEMRTSTSFAMGFPSGLSIPWIKRQESSFRTQNHEGPGPSRKARSVDLHSGAEVLIWTPVLPLLHVGPRTHYPHFFFLASVSQCITGDGKDRIVTSQPLE